MEFAKYVDVFTEKINLAFGIGAALFAALFGQFWGFFLGFLVLNVVDYFTGWAKAKKRHEEDSAKGASGIIKKVGYWVVISVSFFISVMCVELGMMIGVDLSFLNIVGYFTLGTFIINEIRSVLENCVGMGVEIPKVLVNGLDITQKLLNEKTGGTDDEKDSN